MRVPPRLNRLSTKLVLAVAAFMLLLLVTVVTAVNLGLNRLQSQSTQLSAAALTEQGRAHLQERARKEAALSDASLAKAASLSRIAADYLVWATTNQVQQPNWDRNTIQAYADDALLYDANPNRTTDLVIPNYVQLDDAQWQRIAQSAVLDNIFPALLPQSTEVIAMYYQEASMVFRYYPLIGVVDRLAGSPGLAPEKANYMLEDSPAAPVNNPSRQTVWDPPYVDNAGLGLLITANTPVYIDDVYEGVVSVDLSLERLVAQLQTIQPTPGSYAFIVDENGRLVAAAANTLAHLLNQPGPEANSSLDNILGVSLAESEDAELAAVIHTMQQGQTGLAEPVIGGEATLLAYAPMTSLGWSLGIVTPLAELTAPADTIAAETAVIASGILRLTEGLVAFFFLAALVGVFLTNRRLTRPIVDLVAGTETVADGNLDVTIPVTTQDELGQLAQSFNRMTAVLRQTRHSLNQKNEALAAEIVERQQAEAALRLKEAEYRRELEQRVDERTRELLTLLEVSHGLTLVMALPQLLQLILEKLKTVVDYSAASISILEADRLQQVAYRGPGTQADALAIRPSRQELGIIWTQLEQGKPVAIHDLDEETPAAAAYRALSPTAVSPETFQTNAHLRAWTAIPLRLRGQTVGLLALQHPQPGYFSRQRLDLALAFANQAAIAIENARLYEQAQSLAALKERQKLARELHDSVSQALYGIALGTRTANTLMARAEAQPLKQALAEPLDYILSLAEAGLAEMRALIFELRPESLETEGLVAALTKQAAALQARHKLDVVTQFCPEPDISLDAKEVLYRVAQEALHNIAKHAGASHVDLAMFCTDDDVKLTIRDNGKGFDPESDFPGHLGLQSMRERVASLQGDLQILSQPGQGATITVNLPA